MPASYPATTKFFTSKTNITDVVEAAHVNELQEEVLAIQQELGTGDPALNQSPRGTYSSVKARIAAVEGVAGSANHNHDTRYPLTSSFLSTTTPLALGTAAPGTATAASRGDHVHPTTGLATLAGDNTLTGRLDILRATGVTALGIARTGEVWSRLAISSDGVVQFGTGAAAADTNLYRDGADRLRTDDALIADAGQVITFSRPGTLVVEDGKGKMRWPYAVYLISIHVRVNTAPAGAAISWRLWNITGNALVVSGTIAAGAVDSGDVGVAGTLTSGHQIRFDITAVGSTTAGADLTATLTYRRA